MPIYRQNEDRPILITIASHRVGHHCQSATLWG
jgi:hypothetical protein